MTTKFELACLQSRPAHIIAKQLDCPVEAVEAVKWKWRLKRERRYREMKRRQERALRVPKEQAPEFIDRNEIARLSRDEASLAAWVRLPLLYGNHPDSVRGLDGSRYIPNLLKLPLRYARSECGISEIYSHPGTDMRAAA